MKQEPVRLDRTGILRNLAFTLLVWLALLLMAEAVLRAARLRGKPQAVSGLLMSEPHPTRIWQYKAGFSEKHVMPEFQVLVRTNSWRLRGPEVNAPNPLRVLAVGDSFTFGWGVEEKERYSEQLEVLLTSGLGVRRVSVINGGHWSYTFDQQYLLLRELIERLQPQVVVQGIYPAHLVSLQAHALARSGDGDIRAVHNDGITVDESGALRFRSDWLDRPPLGSQVAAAVMRTWLNWRLSRSAMTRDLALYDHSSTLFEPGWAMSREVFSLTGRYLRGHGIRWIALLIPRDFQVSSAEWRFSFDPRSRNLDLDWPTQRMSEELSAAGAEVIDLLPEFRSGYSPNLYFDVDPHWRSEGHARAAKALLPAVQAALGEQGPR